MTVLTELPNRLVRFTSILVLLLVLAIPACLPAGEMSTASPTRADESSYTLFFTVPSAEGETKESKALETALVQAVARARVSVDIASYELNLYKFRDALLAAHQRGVQVRLVTDSDHLEEEAVQDLKAAGIAVLGDRRESLMHNKFVIIDRQEVWTGSMNFTYSDLYRNNNNVLRLFSHELAQDYQVEFNEMFEDDLFGDETRQDTPYPDLMVGNMPVEVYFSPDDGVSHQLEILIGKAEKSINFLAFSFTSNDLGNAILERAKAGVKVVGVMDRSQVDSNQGTEYENFLRAGLDVRLDGNPNKMHHKVIIIDDRIVVTGSYNISANAEERNDENVLIINDPFLASQYLKEFERIYGDSPKVGSLTISRILAKHLSNSLIISCSFVKNIRRIDHW